MFSFLFFVGLQLFIVCIFLGVVNLFRMKFSLCRIGFVDRYRLISALSWVIFFSPSTVTGLFTGTNNMG